jgi:2,4-dienoyl-CoA reductase-like NADH-dependent reductase (Old Yellow Enzyme family)
MNLSTGADIRATQSGQHLFSPLTIRSATLRNRIAVSPMCQYSAEDGLANDWHLVHLGSRAVGGAGLVITEATAVEPRGRITPFDLGIWEDRQIEPLARIVTFIKRQGAVPGIQLAHAGRKASCRIPWEGGAALPPAEGGWQPVAPSPIPFKAQDPRPAELDGPEIQTIVAAFAAAARRARLAGFEVVEIHSAHGYLLHEFLSPISNRRSDQYGGSLAGRTRFPLKVAAAVRAAWPDNLPVFLRLSATDWVQGGWDVEQSVELAVGLHAAGIDLIDCSSGGLVPDAKVPAEPGFQVPFAERIRRDTGVLAGAVGLITQPEQADQIIRTGQADLVLLAREFLRDPYFPLRAARALNQPDIAPVQYARAFIAHQK